MQPAANQNNLWEETDEEDSKNGDQEWGLQRMTELESPNRDGQKRGLELDAGRPDSPSDLANFMMPSIVDLPAQPKPDNKAANTEELAKLQTQVSEKDA